MSDSLNNSKGDKGLVKNFPSNYLIQKWKDGRSKSVQPHFHKPGVRWGWAQCTKSNKIVQTVKFPLNSLTNTLTWSQ